MTVEELIRTLSVFDGKLEVRVCADNGTKDEPGDLYDAPIRVLDDHGPTQTEVDVVAIWLPWGTAIDGPQA